MTKVQVYSESAPYFCFYDLFLIGEVPRKQGKEFICSHVKFIVYLSTRFFLTKETHAFYEFFIILYLTRERTLCCSDEGTEILKCDALWDIQRFRTIFRDLLCSLLLRGSTSAVWITTLQILQQAPCIDERIGRK